MAQKTYIYGLLCPEENKVRYIGQSVRPLVPYKQHLSQAIQSTGRKNAKGHWIRALDARGLKPARVILEEVEGRKGSLHVEADTANRIDAAERRWIQQFVAAGHPLTNSQQVSDDKRLMVEAEERGRELIAALGVEARELLED